MNVFPKTHNLIIFEQTLPQDTLVEKSTRTLTRSSAHAPPSGSDMKRWYPG